MASSDPNPEGKPADLDPRTQSSIFGRLRAYFFTGLVITAPIAITVWATYWFVSLFDTWIKPYIPAAYSPDTYLPFKLPGFGLVFALVTITLIGALAANLVGRTLISWWDNLLDRMPIVRSIYKGSKQIFQTIFSQKGASFRYVCLVEWPRQGAWSLAFVSREIDGSQVGLEAGRPMYAIYVSTTPNPTSGYVFFVDVAEAKILDMSVEDGLKLVISMGLVFPERPLPPAAETAAAPIANRKRLA
ncbi:MAG: DUF502 domain-containing protein [Rhizobiales bacterium]|nr:DUF502 domain-containing protein [Hyphomicrobiales bacterium]MBI3673772.1 DUF502 domain-containing protein [Hyphomicrobiales bacterium]